LSEHWISASAPGPKDGKLDIRSVVLTKRPHTSPGSGGRCGGAGRSIGTVDRGSPGASLPRCEGCAVWLWRDGYMLRDSELPERSR